MSTAPRKLTIYKTYRFIDHDPVLDLVRTMVHAEKVTQVEINKRSSVSTATIGNWMNGKTRRPQFATIAAVIGALHGELSVRDRTGNVVQPTKLDGKQRRRRKK